MSKEADLRRNAQLIVAPLINIGSTVTAGSWTSGTATLTIGAHSIKVGQEIVVYGVTGSNGYNTVPFAAVTAVTATTVSYPVVGNPGPWTGGDGGMVTAQCQLGMVVPDQQFFANLIDLSTATTGPFCMIHPAENDGYDGQNQHMHITVKLKLWYGMPINQNNSFTAFEDSWTAIRDALMLQENWVPSKGTGDIVPPDMYAIRTPDRRTDGTQSVNVWLYELDLTFWGAVPRT